MTAKRATATTDPGKSPVVLLYDLAAADAESCAELNDFAPLPEARRINWLAGAEIWGVGRFGSESSGTGMAPRIAAFAKGFGCRPGARGRPGIRGRRPKASEERTRGKAVSAWRSMEIWRGSGFGGGWLSEDR